MQPTLDRDRLCINTLRTLSMDAVEKAKSGHPGLPMGAAAMAYVLWTRFMRYNPAIKLARARPPSYPPGGVVLLYPSASHRLRFTHEIPRFRQWGSRPGHQTRPHAGVETTTGPLGQGIRQRGWGWRWRKNTCRLGTIARAIQCWIIESALVSDGDLMEGSRARQPPNRPSQTWQSHLSSDQNSICRMGRNKCFTEDVGKRFRPMGARARSMGTI
jgi:transketolase